MKQQSNRIENVAKQIVKYIAEQELYGWPPLCPALYYQPVRPKKEEVTQLNSDQYGEKL